MPTWAIVLIVIAFVGILLLWHRHTVALKSKNKSGQLIGIRNAVESIPVYGGVVKAGRTVLTPFHKLNNQLNSKITAGLQHIPVVGTYLAIPNQVAGSVVHKVTDLFGLN
jgi:hypothetical protein